VVKFNIYESLFGCDFNTLTGDGVFQLVFLDHMLYF